MNPFVYELNVSVDDNHDGLSYRDFTSTSEDKSKREKSEQPPVTPDAVRHIRCLHDLTPQAVLAQMQELVTASAPNLHKVKL